MSLHNAAQHLAAHGRGPDTQLIHMAPSEVAGLQAAAKAHGGSLTVNPHTGLPEAGFLSNILPTLIGAGLAATGVGAPMAALMVGGGYGLAKGDLKSGLMAGLGAYGGAGLTEGLMGSGAADIGKQAAEQATANPINPADASAWGSADTTGQAGLTSSQMQQQVADKMAAATPMDKISAGLANPSQSVEAMGGGMQAAKYGLAAAAPTMQMTPPTVQQPEKYTGPLSKYSMSKDYKPYDQQQPNPYYQAQYQDYRGYAAGGGVIEQMSQANSVGQNTGFPQADIQQGAYATPYQTPVSRNVVADSSDTGVDSFTGEPRGYAAGGHLGSYSDGGHMLKGPGDGMSDSIPAKIGSKQPARLADGEFVIPADVVSHLGNGSSDAGAKQLYAMMDRIRKARTGKKRQAPEVNPTKSMPA